MHYTTKKCLTVVGSATLLSHEVLCAYRKFTCYRNNASIILACYSEHSHNMQYTACELADKHYFNKIVT